MAEREPIEVIEVQARLRDGQHLLDQFPFVVMRHEPLPENRDNLLAFDDLFTKDHRDAGWSALVRSVAISGPNVKIASTAFANQVRACVEPNYYRKRKAKDSGMTFNVAREYLFDLIKEYPFLPEYLKDYWNFGSGSLYNDAGYPKEGKNGKPVWGVPARSYLAVCKDRLIAKASAENFSTITDVLDAMPRSKGKHNVYWRVVGSSEALK